MNVKYSILVSLLLLLLFSSLSLAAQIQTLLVWVEGSLGVTTDYEQMLNMSVGETKGTWITIYNTGNIRDVLRLEGEIEAPAEYKDWIKFAFKCAESVGECDDVPSSERKYADNIQLTPAINETKFYVEVTDYKATLPGQANITITGYSLTNHTKETRIIVIGINATLPSGSAQSSELPGINPLLLPFMALFSALIFYKKVA